MPESTAEFAIRGQRPYIDVALAGKQTRFLYDLGNDVTLINYDTADRLGLDWRSAPEGFSVKGVAPDPIPARLMKVPLQIGQTQPIVIPIGIAPVRDNLLGREGVWEKFDVMANSTRLVFSQHPGIGGANGLGMNVPIQANFGYTTGAVCCDTRIANIH